MGRIADAGTTGGGDITMVESSRLALPAAGRLELSTAACAGPARDGLAGVVAGVALLDAPAGPEGAAAPEDVPDDAPEAAPDDAPDAPAPDDAPAPGEATEPCGSGAAGTLEPAPGAAAAAGTFGKAGNATRLACAPASSLGEPLAAASVVAVMDAGGAVSDDGGGDDSRPGSLWRCGQPQNGDASEPAPPATAAASTGAPEDTGSSTVAAAASPDTPSSDAGLSPSFAARSPS
ncbi:MAG: hypothetical protein IPI49_16620 [Myxococcales bacterium]|nr:hypothetical protein [Myxococcales bacterium]